MWNLIKESATVVLSLTMQIQPLFVAGRLLSHRSEHIALVRLICSIEKTTGWGVCWRLKDLERAWGYDRGLAIKYSLVYFENLHNTRIQLFHCSEITCNVAATRPCLSSEPCLFVPRLPCSAGGENNIARIP